MTETAPDRKPDRLIRAPWTPEQVEALNAFQRYGGAHPLTCGGEHAPGSPALIAYTDGWRCPQPYGESCDYRQDWAYACMLEAAPSGMQRVIDLYEQWVKDGAPPLGVSISRWWDARLAELRNAVFSSRGNRGADEKDT